MKQRPRLKAKLYVLAAEAVEVGSSFGVRGAFKHTDTPSVETIIENVEREMLNALTERFDFDAD